MSATCRCGNPAPDLFIYAVGVPGPTYVCGPCARELANRGTCVRRSDGGFFSFGDAETAATVDADNGVKRVPVDYRYDAINPDFLKCLAQVGAFADEKYGAWEQYAGARLVGDKSPVNHIYEHLRGYVKGEPYDHFDGDVGWQLVAIAYNAMMEWYYLRKHGHLPHPLTLPPPAPAVTVASAVGAVAQALNEQLRKINERLMPEPAGAASSPLAAQPIAPTAAVAPPPPSERPTVHTVPSDPKQHCACPSCLLADGDERGLPREKGVWSTPRDHREILSSAAQTIADEGEKDHA